MNVPWSLWQAYGDTQVIRDHYSSMTRFVDYLVNTSPGMVRGGGDYGDWLNLDDPTPGEVLGTAFFAKDARQLGEMAAAIGNDADAVKYRKLYDDVRAVFAQKFVAADGTVSGDSQTAYIVALTSDLVPAELVEAGRQAVRRDDRASRQPPVDRVPRRGRPAAGADQDRPHRSGVHAAAEHDYPSWGYEIGWGATTVWERWNSINPDGTFNDVGMNSFNHYAYGAAGEWMYRTMAGVSALEPGYRKILIAPQPGHGIDRAELSLDTRYGTVSSKWSRTENSFTLEVRIPPNTSAEIRLPNGRTATVGSGHYRFTE